MIVSVIIPLYNKALYIRRALDSVLCQTFKDFEIIVVDDGSTDDGAEIVSKYLDSRITLIRQSNSGPGAARNRGVSLAKGELIAFLDADDEWLPEYLERTVSYLCANPGVAAISTGYTDAARELNSVNSLWDDRKLFPGEYQIRFGEHSAQFAVYLLAYMSPWSTVTRKSILTKYGGFFSKWKCLYAEDAYLWLQVLLSETIAVSRETLVVFHGESSELSAGLTGPHQIEPFLVDPQELYARVPIAAHTLLADILSVRAVGTSIHYALYGRGLESKALLDKFCKDRRPKLYWKAFVYSRVAALLPFLRVSRNRLFKILNIALQRYGV